MHRFRCFTFVTTGNNLEINLHLSQYRIVLPVTVLQPNISNLTYGILSLKYLRSPTSGCKDIKIRKKVK